VSSLFALLSAVFFAGEALCVRLSLRGSTAATATVVSIGTNITALWVVSAAGGSLQHLLTSASLVFLMAGVFAPAMARLTYYKSINLIGVARAAVLSNTTPLFAAMLAVPVLGERLTWPVGVGTVLVVAGVALAIRPGAEPPSTHSTGRRLTTGGLLALNTAVMASVSFMLRKIGLRLLPDPVLGAALTVTGSLVVLVPYIAARWKDEPLRASRGSLVWLIASGLLTTGGFLAYYLALSLGDVVVVTPLSNTTPLFVVALLSAFRQVERVTAHIVVGAALTVAGVLLIVGI